LPVTNCGYFMPVILVVKRVSASAQEIAFTSVPMDEDSSGRVAGNSLRQRIDASLACVLN
jgi:hypothetical protein